MEFIIDETFGVPGVGTVVAGTLKQGVIGTNSTLLLGPSPVDGSFHKTAIKSIHYKRLPVPTVLPPPPTLKAPVPLLFSRIEYNAECGMFDGFPVPLFWSDDEGTRLVM